MADYLESMKVKFEVRSRGGRVIKKVYKPKRAETVSEFQRRVDVHLQDDMTQAITEITFETGLPDNVRFPGSGRSVPVVRGSIEDLFGAVKNLKRILVLINQHKMSYAEFYKLNDSGFPTLPLDDQDKILKAYEARKSCFTPTRTGRKKRDTVTKRGANQRGR